MHLTHRDREIHGPVPGVLPVLARSERRVQDAYRGTCRTGCTRLAHVKRRWQQDTHLSYLPSLVTARLNHVICGTTTLVWR